MEKQIVFYQLGQYNGARADYMRAADTGNELGFAVEEGRNRWAAYVGGQMISNGHKQPALAHFSIKRHYARMADVNCTEA